MVSLLQDLDRMKDEWDEIKMERERLRAERDRLAGRILNRWLAPGWTGT